MPAPRTGGRAKAPRRTSTRTRVALAAAAVAVVVAAALAIAGLAAGTRAAQPEELGQPSVAQLSVE